MVTGNRRSNDRLQTDCYQSVLSITFGAVAVVIKLKQPDARGILSIINIVKTSKIGKKYRNK